MKKILCLLSFLIMFNVWAEVHTVMVYDNYYDPAELTITSGDEVVWVNQGMMVHSVTSGTGCNEADGVFDSGFFSQEETFSHVFDQAGTFQYYCLPHCNEMLGTIIVTTVSNTISLKNSPNLLIYPNPLNKYTDKMYITCSANGQAKVEMIDEKGTVFQKKDQYLYSGTNSVGLDMDNFPAGVYLIKVTLNEKQQYTKRLIITRDR